MALLCEKNARVTWITLNRPEAFNSLDPTTLQELETVLREFRDDEESLVAVITGSGAKAFCAGADIKTTIPFLKEHRGEWWKHPANIMRGMELWKPIIAAVNGLALGGGLELALACDLRIASENARFGTPEVKLGLIPGWGGTQRLPRVLPMAKAAELLLLGDPIDAQEAYRIGLVNKVVPQDQLVAAATEMAEKLCQLPPLAVRGAKEAMIKGMEMPLEDGLRYETKVEDFVLGSKDLEEGIKAFQEKRPGVFKGK